MIIVCDINENGRKKPFAAVAALTDTLGVSPADWLYARRRGFEAPEGALEILPVPLPPTWASHAWGMRLLWRAIRRNAKKREKTVSCVVMTSPHYLPLLDLLPPSVKTVYYCTDDFRNYDGWAKVAEAEQALVERVDHSFFVSRALVERALREYNVAADRVSVGMNATEERFFSSDSLPVTPPCGELPRPIVGVVGGINERLDFELLLRCADLPQVGTLLLAGPVSDSPCEGLERVLNHKKCRSVGRVPHDSIHLWFQCLDVGLVPYRESDFNTYCSPMRLFDHLASGVPVVCSDACGQVEDFSDQVAVCHSADAFGSAVEAALTQPRMDRTEMKIRWQDRAEEICRVIRELEHA
jgi:glycosyltransferase involved in cell wall biosynthesis